MRQPTPPGLGFFAAGLIRYILAAVMASEGRAFEHAAAALKRDRTVVLEACTAGGWALKSVGLSVAPMFGLSFACLVCEQRFEPVSQLGGLL